MDNIMMETEIMSQEDNELGYAIEVKDLTKKYDGFSLEQVTFSVPRGSIMGFIGQNGAGKTTTIKALLNVIKVDNGSIHLLGKDWLKQENEAKEDIAVVFDEIPFYETFTGIAVSKMFKGLYKNWSEETFFAYLDRFQVPKKKKIKDLSKGMKMKLQIATALSHKAKLLIMDEATTGLDPVVRSEMLDMFREYIQDENNSILMSSHITSDLEKIADGVTFIDKGRLLLTGNKDEILERHGVIKCSLDDFKGIDKEDYISARVSDYNVDVMVSDKVAARRKYNGMLLERTTLEEIMLFYVNREKKEWS